MAREDGFYWVSVDEGEPEVAAFAGPGADGQEGGWVCVMTPEPLADDEGVKVLSERLTPPAFIPPPEDLN